MIKSYFSDGRLEFVPNNPKYAVRPDIGPAFYVSKVVAYLDNSNKSECAIISVNDHNNSKYEFELEMSSLYDRTSILFVLSKHSIIIHPSYAEDVLNFLLNEYWDAKKNGRVEYRHTALGWYNYNGSLHYLYNENSINGIKSYTTRTDMLFTHGDRATYLKLLNDVVFPEPKLALAMAIGYSSVIVSRLKSQIDVGAALLVNFCGASSTGKTTAAQLLASAFSNPVVSNHGLVKSFNSTTNAIYAGIEGVNGLPIVLDDSTTNSWLNLPNLIYTLANGEEKSRCTADGTLKDSRKNWSGTIVITSETPIQDSGQNQGLQVRVLSTQDITWTPSADVAEEIKSVVQSNYGFTGLDFANFISSKSDDELLALYNIAQSEVHELMPKRDALSDRLEQKYAVICMTIHLMNACFDLELDTKLLMSIFIAPEQTAVDERSLPERALSIVQEYLISNPNKFDYSDIRSGYEPYYSFASSSKEGFVEDTDSGTYVAFLSSALNTLLAKNGINETRTVKSRWRDTGATICDKGRVDCKRNGVRCIRFHFPKGLPNLKSCFSYEGERVARLVNMLSLDSNDD